MMQWSNGHDIPWRIFLFPGETVVKRHTCSRDAGNRRPIRVPSREASVAERSVKRSVSTSLTGKPWEDAIHGKARGIIKYRNPSLNHFLKTPPDRYEGGKGKILSRNRINRGRWRFSGYHEPLSSPRKRARCWTGTKYLSLPRLLDRLNPGCSINAHQVETEGRVC